MARGSSPPGQAVRLGLAPERFRERDDLSLAAGVRDRRPGWRGGGAGSARRGGGIRGRRREARGGAAGRPGAPARGPGRGGGFYRRGGWGVGRRAGWGRRWRSGG